jgi:hypothetical protein
VDQSTRILQLIGTFTPLYGVVLTAVLATVLKGKWRVAVLVLVPLLTYIICSAFGGIIGFDGNMLFVALFAVFLTGLCVYYPVLMVIGGVLWIRSHKSDAQ